MSVRGSCACGKVAYKIDGKLHDAASCHCSMCRKSSGSQDSSFALFDQGGFSWLSGKEMLSHYKSAEDIGVVFCSVCGSTLGGTFKGEISWITLGCVDESSTINPATK
jgi:hypothetical protein